MPRKRFRFFKQRAKNDCGPMCLRMVMQYHGRSVDYDEILAASRMDDDGVSAAELIRLARRFGFRGEAYKMSIEQLKDLGAPAIVLWHDNHYVVVTRVTRDVVWIANPMSSYERYPRQRLIQAWDPGGNGGVTIAITPQGRHH